jgi:murein DD-endopeptidase MepM/ murein hydrolase activator NlpD
MKLRGEDEWGSGAYQAPRGNGVHNGVDPCISPGDAIKSLTYGFVTKRGWCYDWDDYPDRKHLRYVQVTLDGNDFRYMYCSLSVSKGDRIKPGDELGMALDLDPFFPGITPHYHFEIIGPDGEYVNPADMIPEIAEALK